LSRILPTQKRHKKSLVPAELEEKSLVPAELKGKSEDEPRGTDRLDELNGEGLEVADDATALDFLCAVYRCRDQPMARRMKAASEAAQYMHPTFKATAMVVAGDSFAARLEAAIARSGVSKDQALLIEAETEAEPLPPTGPSPTPMAAPFASFRRRG
jgi:hypothetical protein